MRRRKNIAAGAVFLTAALIVAGCSSAAPASSEGAAGDGPASVTVGVGGAPFVAALSSDSFARHDLTVTKQEVNSGSAAIPLLLNGQLQFTATDTVGALTAISKGVPLQIVAMAASSGATPDTDATGVMVKNESSIRSAADLAGLKVGVNGIGNASQLSAAAAIDKLGGNAESVDFVEIPGPTMNAAVANGTVDAAVVSEPLVTKGEAIGLRSLFSPMAEALPSVPLFVYVASKAYVAQNPDIVDRFADAVVEANEYASKNPDFVRQFAQQHQNLTAQEASQFTLPAFVPTTLEPSALQQVVDLMVKSGTIDAPIDLTDVVLAR